jgi:hypothetical protein
MLKSLEESERACKEAKQKAEAEQEMLIELGLIERPKIRPFYIEKTAKTLVELFRPESTAQEEYEAKELKQFLELRDLQDWKLTSEAEEKEIEMAINSLSDKEDAKEFELAAKYIYNKKPKLEISEADKKQIIAEAQK